MADPERIAQAASSDASSASDQADEKTRRAENAAERQKKTAARQAEEEREELRSQYRETVSDLRSRLDNRERRVEALEKELRGARKDQIELEGHRSPKRLLAIQELCVGIAIAAGIYLESSFNKGDLLYGLGLALHALCALVISTIGIWALTMPKR